MAGLVDIVLPKKTIELYGVKVPITGIDMDGLGALWERFPQLSDIAASGNIGPKSILALGADVTAAFIAAGTGAAGDEAAEAVAREMPIGDKIELIAAILERSMPRGAVPFVESYVAILASLGMLRSEPPKDGDVENSGNSPKE
jgi:hypothetical protein